MDFPTRPQSQYPIRQRGPFLPLSSDNRCSVNTLGTCAEPLQTDLSTQQCHREAAVPSTFPSSTAPSSNRRSAYIWHTGTLSNLTQVHLLEPRLFKDISGILTSDLMTQRKRQCEAFFAEQDRGWSWRPYGSCRTNTVRARISPAGVPWCPRSKTHLGSC